MEILNEIKKDYVRDLIKQGKRADERKLDEYRTIKLEKNTVSSAEGSATVHMGNTKVLVATKLAVVTPFSDRPKEGVFSTNCELLPLASPTFESGPPSEDSIELARVVDRGIRSSETIDMNSLFIEDEKVWGVFVDLYVLDYDGNLFDAATLAAMSSILDAKIPKYEDGNVIREPDKSLGAKSKVISCTFAKIGDKNILDPTCDEEIAMDARITIATTEKHVCAVQKGKLGSYKKDEILELMDQSFKKGAGLRKLL